MQACDLLSCGRSPSLAISAGAPPNLDTRLTKTPFTLRYRSVSRLKSLSGVFRAQASNVNVGAGSYEDAGANDRHKDLVTNSTSETSAQSSNSLSRTRYLLSIAGILVGCTLLFSLIVSFKGGPSSLVAALAKSGFTAAFTLIFISEIGDKTFFIAALLAMQYDKALVLFGSMGALSLMTVLSVIIGRIFHSVPSKFQTTLPVGEYAAVALLTFFGLSSIKNAWELPSATSKDNKRSTELGELAEAEELVKEKVDKRLTNPLEIIWKSFSVVFFAEWGDRSMLATIALGAALSPWGVASGAITGHLFATAIAVLGGALLANYISEKLVGYLGGGLFIVFAVATLLGVF